MLLKDKLPGARLQPLEQVTVLGAGAGTLTARDGCGREYLRVKSTPEVTFTIGGAAGEQSILLEDAAGRVIETLRFRVDPRTRIDESSGAFRELLELLHFTMADEPMEHFIRYNGKTYFFFVGWLRDHVHTLKGMKYFDSNLYSGIELYRDSQRADGMIWDNVHRRQPPSTERNHWGARFYYGDFERTFDDGTAQFTRIPVENDVEYLFVEGIYYTWKATGDDAWMASCLDAAIRACEYTVNSPYRWSQKFGLLKRGHTIDTWDFQNEADCLSDFAGWPDPMAIRPEKTRFGIMYGDNTGYAVGCEYLAEMLEQVGRGGEAVKYRQRGAEIRERLNKVSWNGRYFTHHVPEDPRLDRDLGIDETTQVSLSNTYSLNRRISHQQCAAILKTYLGLKDTLPPGSPGEWYLIYPPFPRGYGGHDAEWQYMNGGVSPIVAGELARGAFEHGFEFYGVDILRRVLELGNRYGKMLHECYTGAFPPAPPRTFQAVNLLPFANCDASLVDSPETPNWKRGEHPELVNLPKGSQTFHAIPFNLLEGPAGALALSSQPGYAREIEVPVNAKAGSVYLLHTLTRGEIAGTLSVNYADGSTQSAYVRLGTDVLPLNHWVDHTLRRDEHDKVRAEIAWTERHPQHHNIYVTVTGFDTDAEKEIRSLSFKAADDGALWFVLGVSVSDAPVWFRAKPISFGIPRGWGAAACTYALIEGLAGVVDDDTAYRSVSLSPRWAAAGVDTAQVTVHYPASGGYVTYQYEINETEKRLRLTVTGSGQKIALRMLLPASVQSVKSARVDDQPAAFQITSIETSRYINMDIPLTGVHTIEFTIDIFPSN